MNDWIGLLPSICQKYSVDPLLARAFVMVESGGDPWRCRFEPGWSYFEQTVFYARQLGITNDTEKIQQATSWGLMQVMGAVCRENGFNDHLTKVTMPSIGLDIGVRKLGRLLLQYKNPNDAIASYNGGSPVVDIKTGRYKNQEYVAKVLGYYKSFKGG